MSTRAQIFFYDKDNSQPFAGIYHHWDGYPEHMIPSLKRAMDAYQAAAQEDGFGYRAKAIVLSDYAAFYVLTEKRGMGNVYLDIVRHGDVDFEYRVWAKDDDVKVNIIDCGEGEQTKLDTLANLLVNYPVPEEELQAT